MDREAISADETCRMPPDPGGVIFRVEIRRRDPVDPEGIRMVDGARAHGIRGLRACRVERLCFLKGPLSPAEVDRLSRLLLTDPVAECFRVTKVEHAHLTLRPFGAPDHWIEVTWRPGVTDPSSESLLRAAREAGFEVQQAAWGTRFLLWGDLGDTELERLALELCCNPVIQRYAVDRAISPPFLEPAPPNPIVEVIPIREASEEDLVALSEHRRLALNQCEMRAIQEHFRRLGRDPTDVELETLAQTWSEHCVHKTFKARIRYTGPAPGMPSDAPAVTMEINGLLRTYIQAATERADRSWVRSAFVDNAGIIALDDRWDVAIKVETHNHPSAVEPFGGASTGVGGVIRDILGVSARPIANLDVLCFPPSDLLPSDRLPGTLPPQRIIEGVIRGIEDYGNKMGIPTVCGAVRYHPGYRVTPLVFCGCLGILPRGSHPTAPQPGDLIVLIGGRTGRDGLGGATFSSARLDPESATAARQAVQIGHPILEKQLLEVILQAREEGLYHAITDCGAGGLSSAVGEMARSLGAQVHLDQVPLKDHGLRPWEIWLSESQERMVLAIPPENWPRFHEICMIHGVEAAVIGTFEASGRLQIFYRGHRVGELEMAFLHEGRPSMILEARWGARSPSPSDLASSGPMELSQALLALLSHPNIRSREEILRRYDHEVQGATAIKPLVGVANQGPSDAVVLVPRELLSSVGSLPGIALAVGLAPQYGERDPYLMAWAAIDEAFRNLIAVGADPDRVALLDNFCWGNPHDPEQLGGLVRCAQGCFDAARAYQAPFVSGKDSLHNEHVDATGRVHAIPGTILITAVGRVPDIQRAVTMDLKCAGDWLYLVGDTRPELGNSHYAMIGGAVSPEADRLPQPVPQALDRMRALHRAIAAGWVQACHDLSEGGLGVALAEMCLAGRLGAHVDLRRVPGIEHLRTDEEALFSESLSRFLVEVRPEDATAFEACLTGHPVARIGIVTEEPLLQVIGQDGSERLRLPVEALERAWRGEPAPSGSQASSPSTPRPSARPTIYVPRGRPRVLILQAPGTNRDGEAALACREAGGEPEIVPMTRLLRGERSLLDYAMLILPGGFSYGDDLGAGTLWALELRHRWTEMLERFIASGRPVLGICNGFQALVKAGLLPGPEFLEPDGSRLLTLAPNASGRFECRWVWLRVNPQSPCLFTEGVEELLYCPVAHGEGRVMARSEDILDRLEAQGLIALTYVDPDGQPASYPFNPNGSQRGIAGICNAAGNVLGLMPHPEDHIFPWQHPRWRRGESGGLGLILFQNALRRC
ncbi:MAG: phosphoribosylformylglycinamidine synthase subunit PurL [Anaerolineae bacterium]|nr:phosphoribosylformylglycinamidine synthase subunit PurL [Thermoflexus sp.]MDW8064402.1 phosphoribosylformylglycinamidine synthase subunit PurL [Anaerolineae bacterium]